jgi:rhamnogalacturonan endolyase
MKNLTACRLVLAVLIAFPFLDIMAQDKGSGRVVGQDQRERIYNYPILKPQHDFKPPVEGWADTRVEEKLDRGLIAQKYEDGSVYIGWRLLKTDPEDIAFNVYRSVNGGEAKKLNSKPVKATTDFVDRQSQKGVEASYFIRSVFGGKEKEASKKATPLAGGKHPSLHSRIEFQGDYSPHKIAVADLNGDGCYDFVIRQPNYNVDPGGKQDTTGTTYKIEAYLSDGTFLWRKDLGTGIEPGTWYSPMVVYDFDGDGKAEVATKTAPAINREPNGRILSGPEWCSLFDGMTGEEIDKVDWPPRNPRHGEYNRNNRQQMGIAYLDGKTPCLLLLRGTYKLIVMDAYQMKEGKLDRLWHWDSDEENPVIRSQGAHGMHPADVDEDGRDEIVLGSVVLDDNGTALWSVGLGHPDKCFVTDIDPQRPGMEVFYCIEVWRGDGKGVCMADAKTGEIIWGIGDTTWHVGNGMVADIDPSLPGLECFAHEDPRGAPPGWSNDKYMFTAQGEKIGTMEDIPGCNNWVFWDADLLRETFDVKIPADPDRPVTSVMKYKGNTLSSGIEGKVIMMADILGDWREELITVKNGELSVYTTTIPAVDRRVCLMQDPVYRPEVAHRSMGYPQPPVPGYYLGVPPEKASEFDPIIPR